ncbi:ABC transporter substrate-binding protein [Blastopirellula sp. J2-11]|uniref:ABC transporter substrate-binding protein n=1 Tax=Blastopirellula sp. J2-11 TaxID=2943192 RepID=UPI0021C5C0F7|nr:ABC transporter substrate-binding protein [Blastopirellula sp. J2-11]UUO08202.1 ABC transporter substrate-binding protein [Blastopirellula sp. J2-11]
MFQRILLLRAYCAAYVLLSLAANVCAAEASDDRAPLRFGMSTALTGPVADLGIEMHRGVLAAFAEANASGGIQGRQLELIALDDGYEPSETGPNIRRLIEKDQVLAIVGNVGTPTAIVAAPIARRSGVPFIGALTGAGVLRKTPPDRYVINFRASYAEETSAMVDALVASGIQPNEIAFITQRDGYGDAGFSGGSEALKRHGVARENTIAHGRYERNTMAVEGALADLILHQPLPKAVILVGAYAPCAKLIRLAKECDIQTLFLSVSFVAPNSLAAALGDQADGVIVSQIVPDIHEDVPINRQHRAALVQLKQHELAPTPISLEGYIVGRMLILALKRIPGEIDRDAIVVACEGLGSFDLGLGVPLRLSGDEHQASHAIWASRIEGGEVKPMEWSDVRDMERN